MMDEDIKKLTTALMDKSNKMAAIMLDALHEEVDTVILGMASQSISCLAAIECGLSKEMFIESCKLAYSRVLNAKETLKEMKNDG